MGIADLLNGGTDPGGDPVQDVVITDPGQGYTSAPTMTLTGGRGSGATGTVMIAPELTTSQRRAVKAFELDRWMPTLLSCMKTRPVRT